MNRPWAERRRGTFLSKLATNPALSDPFTENEAALEYAELVQTEIKQAEALSQEIVQGDHAEEVKREFQSVFDRLTEFERLGALYNTEAEELLLELTSGDVDPIVDSLVRVQAEEDELVKGLAEVTMESNSSPNDPQSAPNSRRRWRSSPC